MNYMLLFLAACMVIGLWSSTRAKRAGVIFALAVALIVYFLLFPTKL